MLDRRRARSTSWRTPSNQKHDDQSGRAGDCSPYFFITETKSMKRIALAIILLTLSTAVCAQSISPLNSEHSRKKVRSEFSLSNDSFSPLTVTLEPMSLAIVNGKAIVTDLAPTTHVRLSEYSANIQP